MVYDILRKRKDGRMGETFVESLDRLREIDYRKGEGECGTMEELIALFKKLTKKQKQDVISYLRGCLTSPACTPLPVPPEQEKDASQSE